MQHRTVIALAFGLALGLGACGDGGTATADTTGSEDAADTSDEGRSFYRIEMVRSDNPEPIVIDRDLTGREKTYMAFGSTHIAPAVSFAVTDNVIVPLTITVGFNFGIVVPSNDFPIDTSDVGTYAFSAEPPGLEITVTGLEYRTRVEGSAGSMIITDWSTVTGDLVAGTFSGRVIQETTLATKRYLDVSGSFHFVLPTPENGQPQ